jgi:hypothetical protein
LISIATGRCLGLANTPANLFQRRALWESAIASYGRLIVSDQKRKNPFKEFVEEITGVDGLAIHERIHSTHRLFIDNDRESAGNVRF